MKRSFHLLLLIVVQVMFTIALRGQSQSSFTVIKVNGAIYSSTLKRALASGDVISESDKLKFDSKASYMHVVNSAGTLKTVKDVTDNSPRELMGLLQTFVNNKSAKASRGLSTESQIEKLRHYFNYESMLILGDGRLSINTDELSLKAPSGVKAEYTLNGKDNAQVISDEMGFNLGKTFIFKSYDISKPPIVNIIYYEDINDRFFSTVEVLGEFRPYYTNEETLTEELKVLVGILRLAGGDKQSIETNLVNYLTAEYQAPVLPNLRDWLDKNELLKY